MTNQLEVTRKEKEYKIVGGTSYNAETSDKVISVLESVRQQRIRVRLFYGDKATGNSWLDRYDIEGTISRSTGNNKIPILIHNVRSMGGGGILDSSIIRIQTTGHSPCVLYQAENFQSPKLFIEEGRSKNDKFPWSIVNGLKNQVVFNCESHQKAEKEIKFLTGYTK